MVYLSFIYSAFLISQSDIIVHFHVTFENKQQGRLDLTGKLITDCHQFHRCLSIFHVRWRHILYSNAYQDSQRHCCESQMVKPFRFLILDQMCLYVTGNDTQGSEAGQYLLGFKWSRENRRLRIGYVRNIDQGKILTEWNGSFKNLWLH